MALTVPIVADTSGLRRGLGSAENRLARFRRTAGLAAGVAAGALAVGLAKSVQSASNLNEQISKANVVFGKSAGEIQKWSQTTSDSLGLSRRNALEAASQFALFAKSAGLSGKATVDFSTQMVKLAGDLASFNNATPEETILAIGAALRGENEPIRRFGVLIDDASLRTEALRQGIVKTTKDALTPQQKVLAAHALILKQTTDAQGDFARTSDGLANQQRIVRAQIEDLSAKLGMIFLPAVATAAGAVTDFIRRFEKQPTLRAKIELIASEIVKVAGRAYTNLITWWTTTQRTELPARVVITPSGRQQFDAFFADLERRARASGARVGQRFADFLIDSFTSQGRARSGQAIQDLAKKIGAVGQFHLRITGTTLVNSFIEGFFSGFVPKIVERLRDAFTSAIINLVPSFTKLGGDIRGAIAKGLGRKGQGSLANVMTQTIRDAVQAARSTLAGMGGTLAGMLGTIIGSSSPEARKARQIRAQQRRQAAEREELRLRAALASAETDEERAQAQQDLDDFLLDQEAQRLEDSVEQNKTAADQKINDLVESFNQGEISAQEFADALNAIIGAGPGEELGKAFAGAFAREVQGIINFAKDIGSVVGQAQPIAAVAGGGVADTQKQENQRRYDEALDDYRKRRKARRERAENFRKRPNSAGGAKITPAEEQEIRDIMAAWDKENPKPTRAQFGLALGGILKQPTFVAGEAGKEAVIPLESGSAMRILRDAIGGGGRSTQVINLTVNAGLGTDPDELSQIIVNSIKRYEKRNGVVFQGPIVSTLANTTGKTSTASDVATFNKVRSLRRG